MWFEIAADLRWFVTCFRFSVVTSPTCWCMVHQEPGRRPASCVCWGSCTEPAWRSCVSSTRLWWWVSGRLKLFHTSKQIEILNPTLAFVSFCFQAPSKKKIEINTIASNYHLEVNARQGWTSISSRSKEYLNFHWLISFFVLFSRSDAGNQDRVVIQELIKTVAQSQQIQSSTQRDFKGSLSLPTLRLWEAVICKLHSFALSCFANGGGQTHQRCPACFEADDGKVYGHLSSHPLLHLHLKGHRANPEPMPGRQSSPAQHRRGKMDVTHLSDSSNPGGGYRDNIRPAFLRWTRSVVSWQPFAKKRVCSSLRSWPSRFLRSPGATCGKLFWCARPAESSSEFPRRHACLFAFKRERLLI